MRHPEAGIEKLQQARGYYRQAQEISIKVWEDEANEDILRGAGLMTAATARVEKLMAERAVAEIQNEV